MELWIVEYLAVGVVVLLILWNVLKIDWNAEATNTKLLMIATPFAWPLVLGFIIYVRVFK